MNATVSDSGRKAKLAASITPASREMEGLPVSYQPSFSFEVSQFGPAEIQKALADSERITLLLREHPKEMAAIVNHVLAGETHAAAELAMKIGFTEDAFRENGGGILFWCAIAAVGTCIFLCAAFGGCK
jgi:hypothetical protein